MKFFIEEKFMYFCLELNFSGHIFLLIFYCNVIKLLINNNRMYQSEFCKILINFNCFLKT